MRAFNLKNGKGDPFVTAKDSSVNFENDLKYKSKEVATKEEVNAVNTKVDAIVQNQFKVVEQLPTTGKPNTIYLVPKASGGTQNAKDEYIWVNNAWELIGNTEVDISGKQDKLKFYKEDANSAYVDGPLKVEDISYLTQVESSYIKTNRLESSCISSLHVGSSSISVRNNDTLVFTFAADANSAFVEGPLRVGRDGSLEISNDKIEFDCTINTYINNLGELNAKQVKSESVSAQSSLYAGSLRVAEGLVEFTCTSASIRRTLEVAGIKYGDVMEVSCDTGLQLGRDLTVGNASTSYTATVNGKNVLVEGDVDLSNYATKTEVNAKQDKLKGYDENSEGTCVKLVDGQLAVSSSSTLIGGTLMVGSSNPLKISSNKIEFSCANDTSIENLSQLTASQVTSESLSVGGNALEVSCTGGLRLNGTLTVGNAGTAYNATVNGKNILVEGDVDLSTYATKDELDEATTLGDTYSSTLADGVSPNWVGYPSSSALDNIIGRSPTPYMVSVKIRDAESLPQDVSILSITVKALLAAGGTSNRLVLSMPVTGYNMALAQTNAIPLLAAQYFVSDVLKCGDTTKVQDVVLYPAGDWKPTVFDIANVSMWAGLSSDGLNAYFGPVSTSAATFGSRFAFPTMGSGDIRRDGTGPWIGLYTFNEIRALLSITTGVRVKDAVTSNIERITALENAPSPSIDGIKSTTSGDTTSIDILSSATDKKGTITMGQEGSCIHFNSTAKFHNPTEFNCTVNFNTAGGINGTEFYFGPLRVGTQFASGPFLVRNDGSDSVYTKFGIKEDNCYYGFYVESTIGESGDTAFSMLVNTAFKAGPVLIGETCFEAGPVHIDESVFVAGPVLINESCFEAGTVHITESVFVAGPVHITESSMYSYGPVYFGERVFVNAPAEFACVVNFKGSIFDKNNVEILGGSGGGLTPLSPVPSYNGTFSSDLSSAITSATNRVQYNSVNPVYEQLTVVQKARLTSNSTNNAKIIYPYTGYYGADVTYQCHLMSNNGYYVTGLIRANVDAYSSTTSAKSLLKGGSISIRIPTFVGFNFFNHNQGDSAGVLPTFSPNQAYVTFVNGSQTMCVPVSFTYNPSLSSDNNVWAILYNNTSYNFEKYWSVQFAYYGNSDYQAT